MRRRRRRSTRRRSSGAGRRRASSRAGFAAIPLLAGATIGGAAAIGGGVFTQMAANLAKFELPQVVKDFAPIAGGALIAGITYMVPKFRNLTIPTLVGAGAVTVLNMLLARNTGAKGYQYYPALGYNRLRGSGNVARTLNAQRGAGNVAMKTAESARATMFHGGGKNGA